MRLSPHKIPHSTVVEPTPQLDTHNGHRTPPGFIERGDDTLPVLVTLLGIEQVPGGRQERITTWKNNLRQKKIEASSTDQRYFEVQELYSRTVSCIPV